MTDLELHDCYTVLRLPQLTCFLFTQVNGNFSKLLQISPHFKLGGHNGDASGWTYYPPEPRIAWLDTSGAVFLFVPAVCMGWRPLTCWHLVVLFLRNAAHQRSFTTEPHFYSTSVPTA